jgi:hypothetical protein
MTPGFPLKLAFAIVFIYAFVTILFLDGKNRDDAGSPPRIAEKSPAPRLPAPDRPSPAN